MWDDRELYATQCERGNFFLWLHKLHTHAWWDRRPKKRERDELTLFYDVEERNIGVKDDFIEIIFDDAGR